MNVGLLELLKLFLGIFAIILFFVILISKFFVKPLWRKPLWLKTGVFLGISHFILATIALFYIGSNLKYDLEYGMFWGIFTYVDFPVSSLLLTNFSYNIFESVITNFVSSYYFNYMIFPYIVFGVFGSLQYCLWGRLIGEFIKTIRRKA